jgi:hypothetical protein
MRVALVPSLCALAMFWALAGSASAAPVTWTLNGVTFQDGATASGSFVYDATTNTYSNVNITTSGGTILPGASYAFVCTPPCGNDQPAPQLVLFLTAAPASNQTGLTGLGLVFFGGLTDPPAKAIPLLFGVEATCDDPTCDDLNEPGRVASGEIISVPPGPIPTLSEWGTILLVLSLLTVGTWQLAGRPALFHVAIAGGFVLCAPSRRLLDCVVVGQIVAAVGLGLYASLIKPLAPQDPIGAVLAGTVLGLLLECSRRGREH